MIGLFVDFIFRRLITIRGVQQGLYCLLLIAQGFERFNSCKHRCFQMLFSLVRLYNLHHILLRREIMRSIDNMDRRGELLYLQEFGCFGDNLFLYLQRAVGNERLTDVRAYFLLVIFTFRIASIPTLFGDGIKYVVKLRGMDCELAQGQCAKTLFDDKMQPCVESNSLVIFLVPILLHIFLDDFPLQVLLTDKYGFAFGKNFLVLKILSSVELVFQHQCLVRNLELIKVDGRHTQFLHAGEAMQGTYILVSSLIEFFNGSVLLFVQFLVQGLRIVGIEPYQCGFSMVLHHLAQTAATGLQHHILRARSFLRKNNAGQTLAVPALLANLSQKHDFDFRKGSVQ